MKVVCLSDTHGQHSSIEVPDGDILIHAGDFTKKGTPSQVADFMHWFKALPHPNKVFIAGNHDFMAERDPDGFRKLIPSNCTYLENELKTIAGLRIWGSPITPWFFDWAFNRQRGADIRPYWDAIASPIDILITHGPPYGILDKTFRGEAVGCKDLLPQVFRSEAKLHIFGHIHEAAGQTTQQNVHFINASNLNLSYKFVNPPITLEL